MCVELCSYFLSISGNNHSLLFLLSLLRPCSHPEWGAGGAGQKDSWPMELMRLGGMGVSGSESSTGQKRRLNCLMPRHATVKVLPESSLCIPVPSWPRRSLISPDSLQTPYLPYPLLSPASFMFSKWFRGFKYYCTGSRIFP